MLHKVILNQHKVILNVSVWWNKGGSRENSVLCKKPCSRLSSPLWICLWTPASVISRLFAAASLSVWCASSQLNSEPEPQPYPASHWAEELVRPWNALKTGTCFLLLVGLNVLSSTFCTWLWGNSWKIMLPKCWPRTSGVKRRNVLRHSEVLSSSRVWEANPLSSECPWSEY